MPGNSPLTQTSYALLDDEPNIENAGKPGFKNLERFAVPRFTSTTARNLAFADSEATAPEVDQLCSVNGTMYAWNGSQWEDFKTYFGIIPTTKAKKTNDELVQGTTNYQDDDELFVTLTEANTDYIVDMWLIVEGNPDADLRFRLAWPDGCLFHGGILTAAGAATQVQDSGMSSAAVINLADYTSVFWVAPAIPNTTNYVGVRFQGTLQVGPNLGVVKLQWALRVAQSWGVHVCRGSWLRLEPF